MISYSWYIRGTTPAALTSFPGPFRTYVENEPYVRLKEDFDALNSSYSSLQANYTALLLESENLNSDKIDESSATSVMYFFLLTTGVFVVTTILLLGKRPQTTTW